MPGNPLLVVLGATGTQGGSVVSHFLSISPPPYRIRGITRDVSSHKSCSLAALGVDMVAADFDDSSSLDTAFRDASVIFSVTDFWQTFADPLQREKALAAGQNIGIFSKEHEAQQNRNIIDAAAKVTSLERFIFSSLPNTNALSGGKYAHVYHFEGKAMGEEYGRSVHPLLWEKTSVLYAGYYLENYFVPTGAIFLPKLNKNKDTLVLYLEEPLATALLPFYSAVEDTGALVYSLLGSAPGKKLIGVRQWLSFRDFAMVIAHVVGKELELVNRNPVIDMGDPDLEKDHQDMIGFCIEYGFDGGEIDKSIVQPSELGVPIHLTSLKEWCEKHDWEEILEVE